MKVLFLVLAILSLPIAAKSQTAKQVAKSQPLPEWFRVYTFDESIIELNTNYVMFSNHKVERVRFRWLFQAPQTLSGKPKVKYQTVLQEIQFDCLKKTFRIYAVQWLDQKGRLVASVENRDSEKMQEIEFGSMMEKLFLQACKLIELRKREPALEQ